MSVGVLDVAKKRAGDGRRRTRKNAPDDSRQTILSLKGQMPFRDWLERLAAHDRRSMASVIEVALAHYAKAIGFPEEPPER